MVPVRVGPTLDRSILGSMNDFVRMTPYYLPEHTWTEADLRLAEEQLWDSPCRVSSSGAGGFWPMDRAHELLSKRWAV
jgi:hypothetical protein